MSDDKKENTYLQKLLRDRADIIKNAENKISSVIEIIEEIGVKNFKDTIVFVEVKARKYYHYGDPKLAVTLKKQMKISMVALQYLKDKGLGNSKARFDVVSINVRQDTPHFEIIKNAFELAYG